MGVHEETIAAGGPKRQPKRILAWAYGVVLVFAGGTVIAAAQNPPPGEPPFAPILLASKLGEMC